MIVNHLKSGRRLVALAALAVVATSAFGFAASNAVPASNAGDGSDVVSGGDVTDINYTLNTNNPAEITAVSFTYTPDSDAPDHVRATLRSSADAALGTANCTASGTTWTCTFATAVNVVPVARLQVTSFD